MKREGDPETLTHQRTPHVITIDILKFLSLRDFSSFGFSHNFLYLRWLFCDLNILTLLF